MADEEKQSGKLELDVREVHGAVVQVLLHYFSDAEVTGVKLHASEASQIASDVCDLLEASNQHGAPD